MKSIRAFTLIELLIVIAIIAILGSATVLVLNPVEIIKQGRDGTRITDVENIQKSLNLTLFNNPSLVDSLLSTNIYLSLPSGSCPLSPPTGYTYVCNATSANINKTDGTGWIPLTLQNMASLPTDPNSNFYYAFIANPTTKTFTVTALLESEKQTKLSAAKDGGTDPGRFEKGDTGLWSGASGLVGYYSFDEGTGGIAYDSSGNNNSGTWNGIGTHYNTGKVGSYAGQFNGTSDYVSAGNIMPVGSYTKIAWIKNTASGSYNIISGSPGHAFWNPSLQLSAGHNSSWSQVADSNTLVLNTWYFVAVTFDPVVSSGQMILYKDGSMISQASSIPTHQLSTDLLIGSYSYGNFFTGQIDDARIYNRALSADEIKSIYNAHK